MTSKEWFPLETKAMGSAFKATFPGTGTGHLGMGWLGLDVPLPTTGAKSATATDVNRALPQVRPFSLNNASP